MSHTGIDEEMERVRKDITEVIITKGGQVERYDCYKHQLSQWLNKLSHA